MLSGGTLSPGASVESLSVGAVTLSGTSTFFYEVDSSVPLSAAADLLTANGNLSIQAGSLLEFADLAPEPSPFAAGTKFTLISYGTNTWDGGLFTYQFNQLSNGMVFTAGLNNWQISYNDSTGGSNFTSDQLPGSSVTITVVPEPATLRMVLAALACGGFSLRRRRVRA